MRQAVIAALVAFGIAALAGEGIELEPRVRVPGEPPTLAVSEALLKALGMTADDIQAVVERVKELNAQRQGLFKAVEEAKKELAAAQKKADDAAAALSRQETALHDFIRERLPQDQKTDYAVRVQLQPVIDWLNLTTDQVTQLIAKQKELLANDPRPKLAAASEAVRTRTEPLTADQRKAHIELLKQAAAFNQTWLANIESVLTDEQKQTWRTRFRRTSFSVDLGAAPAPAPPAAPAAKE